MKKPKSSEASDTAISPASESVSAGGAAGGAAGTPAVDCDSATNKKAAVKEIGGRDGPDPTRFGDWEKAGRCIDF